MFDPERTLAHAPSPARLAQRQAGDRDASVAAAEAPTARFLAAAAKARQPIAWVANYGSDSVTPGEPDHP